MSVTKCLTHLTPQPLSRVEREQIVANGLSTILRIVTNIVKMAKEHDREPPDRQLPEEQQQPKGKPFRFLNQAEFEALSEREKLEYVNRAFEELKRSRDAD